MQQDEQKAMAIRARHRQVFEALTPPYGGKVLQYFGDGTLSIFNSSVAAVECAVEIQRAFAEDPQVPLRIGIHTGDIVYDEVDVFGDGVNVASRIEPVCVPGGIYLSRRVQEDIRNHEWLQTRLLGAFEFKGVAQPMPLYAVTNEGVATPTESDWRELRHSSAKLINVVGAAPAAAKEGWPEKLRTYALFSIPILLLGLILTLFLTNSGGSTLPAELQKELSIAVLPFDNFSSDPENDYFSDGITEDILTLLAKIEGFKVVSRTSVMQYKGANKNIREIARELNANHILEGSVRRDGDRVRIVAQLVNAEAGDHVWVRTYDKQLTQIFDVQSQVAEDIAMALENELSQEDREQINRVPTTSITAYDYYLQGRNYYMRYTEEDNKHAIELFGRALQIDPDFALAHAGLGDALAQKAFRLNFDEATLDSAIAASSRAIELDEKLSEGHKSLGLAFHYRGWYDKALEEYHKAIKYNPNNEMATNNIGTIHFERGNLASAIRWGKRSLAINPQHAWSLQNLANMYYYVGADENCITLGQRGMELHPDFAPLPNLLTSLYLRKDDFRQARYYADQLEAQDQLVAEDYRVLFELYLRQGDLEAARNYLDQWERADEKATAPRISRAYLYLQSGREDVGRALLKSLTRELENALRQNRKTRYLVELGMVYALLEQPELALRWLNNAAQANWMDYAFDLKSPLFDNLRNDADFKTLRKRLDNHTAGQREKVRRVSAEDDDNLLSSCFIPNTTTRLLAG